MQLLQRFPVEWEDRLPFSRASKRMRMHTMYSTLSKLVCCFPGPFAVMVFIALWNNQDDTYTNSAHVVDV